MHLDFFPANYKILEEIFELNFSYFDIPCYRKSLYDLHGYGGKHVLIENAKGEVLQKRVPYQRDFLLSFLGYFLTLFCSFFVNWIILIYNSLRAF